MYILFYSLFFSYPGIHDETFSRGDFGVHIEELFYQIIIS